MNKPDIATAGSALRRRLIDDMTLRRFGEKTQHAGAFEEIAPTSTALRVQKNAMT